MRGTEKLSIQRFAVGGFLSVLTGFGGAANGKYESGGKKSEKHSGSLGSLKRIHDESKSGNLVSFVGPFTVEHLRPVRWN
jgi:hypothetical protein